MRNLNKKKIFIVFCLILLLVSACNIAQGPNIDETNEHEVEKSPTLSMDSGYPPPISQTNIDDSYPITTESNIQVPLDEIADLPEAKDPSAGKTSFSGVLYSYSMNQLIPNTPFYLSPAIGEENTFPPIIAGPNPEQGDINDFTDNNAAIILNDIEPGNYYLIVWAPNNWGFAVIDTENEQPLMLELTEGTAHNFDVILVQWP